MIARPRQEHLRVLISGAGAGIGFACASAFAACGAELILCDHDAEALTKVSELLGAYSRYCDVVSDSSVHIFAAQMSQDFESFDVLINAAGNGFVRALGMVRMAKELLPLIRKGSGARLIINIAPCCEPKTRHPLFPHASSQAGFHQLSDGLAAQVPVVGGIQDRAQPRLEHAALELLD